MFNNLKKFLVLPEENFFWIHRKVAEAFEMYYDYKQFGKFPWEIRGETIPLVEDMQVLKMMDRIMHDREVYAQRKKKNDDEVAATIEKFKQENKPNKSNRRMSRS